MRHVIVNMLIVFVVLAFTNKKPIYSIIINVSLITNPSFVILQITLTREDVPQNEVFQRCRTIYRKSCDLL